MFVYCVTGQSGLGKSTMINSLFMTDVFEDSAYEDAPNRVGQTTQVLTLWHITNKLSLCFGCLLIWY